MPTGISSRTRPVAFRLSNEDYARIERFIGKPTNKQGDQSVGDYCKRVVERWIHRKHR